MDASGERPPPAGSLAQHFRRGLAASAWSKLLWATAAAVVVARTVVGGVPAWLNAMAVLVAVVGIPTATYAQCLRSLGTPVVRWGIGFATSLTVLLLASMAVTAAGIRPTTVPELVILVPSVGVPLAIERWSGRSRYTKRAP